MFNMDMSQVCDDYIMFRGEKTSLCGRGDGRSFTLPASGPLGFTFSSDERPVDRVRTSDDNLSLSSDNLPFYSSLMSVTTSLIKNSKIARVPSS